MTEPSGLVGSCVLPASEVGEVGSVEGGAKQTPFVHCFPVPQGQSCAHVVQSSVASQVPFPQVAGGVKVSQTPLLQRFPDTQGQSCAHEVQSSLASQVVRSAFCWSVS